MQRAEILAAIKNGNAVVINKDSLLETARYLKKELFFDNLHCITAVDRPEKLEVIYTLYSIRGKQSLTLKVYLSPEDLNIESLTAVWRSADWLEREVYDLFGIKFLNHPDLRRILNPYDWKVYPLRKNFSDPEFIKKPKL